MVSGFPGFAQTYLSCTRVHGEGGVGILVLLVSFPFFQKPQVICSTSSQSDSPFPPVRLQLVWHRLSWWWFQHLVHYTFVAIAAVVILVHFKLIAS